MIKEKNTIFNALVVDDNEVNTLILKNMLDLFSIHTDQIYQGEKAVLMAEEKAYHIIFIDHIMPDMDGIQTVEAIRKASHLDQKPIIIALTSDLTKCIINRYKAAGANAVCEKPLSLTELANLLNQWCPEVQLKPQVFNNVYDSSDEYYEIIKNVVDNVIQIDYVTGLRTAFGNPKQFFMILEATLKDLRDCINIIVNSHTVHSISQLKSGVHKLKNIMSNIGAKELLNDSMILEKLIFQGDWIKIKLKYDLLVDKLRLFEEKLNEILQKYYKSVRSEKTSKVYDEMTEEEYEQCLLSTIYYIKRYEYDNIIKEIERLIILGRSGFKQEYALALRDIREFNYEKALNRILEIKNKTCNMSE